MEGSNGEVPPAQAEEDGPSGWRKQAAELRRDLAKSQEFLERFAARRGTSDPGAP